jgi:hypothetical protein
MQAHPLDPEALEVLTFLYGQRQPTSRTLEVVKHRCQMTAPRQAYDLLTRLVKEGYLNRVEGHYDLTAFAKSVIRDIEARRAASAAPPDRTQIVFNGSISGSSVSVSGEQHQPPPQTSLQQSAAKAFENRRALSENGDGRKADVSATPLAYQDVVGMHPPASSSDLDATLQLDGAPVPSYTIHPMRFTDTSFEQNEYLKAHPDTRVRFVISFDDYPAALPLPIIDSDRLGRERNNDVMMRYDSSISRHHCAFFVKENNGQYELYVKDLNSRNGTWVNGVRCQPNVLVRLTHGARLKIGTTGMVVTQIAEGSAPLADALKIASEITRRNTTGSNGSG